MSDSIDLDIPETLDRDAIVKWLSVIEKIAASKEKLAIDVVTDVDKQDEQGNVIPNEDWVSIKIHIGTCPGRQLPINIERAAKVDPPPDTKTAELTAGGRLK